MLLHRVWFPTMVVTSHLGASIRRLACVEWLVATALIRFSIILWTTNWPGVHSAESCLPLVRSFPELVALSSCYSSWFSWVQPLEPQLVLTTTYLNTKAWLRCTLASTSWPPCSLGARYITCRWKWALLNCLREVLPIIWVCIRHRGIAFHHEVRSYHAFWKDQYSCKQRTIMFTNGSNDALSNSLLLLYT